MSFAWPAALIALLVIPVAVALYVVVQRRRARYAVRFTNLDLLANVVEETPGWRRHLPAVLYLGAIAALLLAVARPEREIDVPKQEATVILVMDISGSMNATDIEPTRLVAAQEAGGILVDELPEGFRVALVTFANGVQTRVIPTDDREALRTALAALRANGGTAMGEALAHALDLAQLDDETATAPTNGATATPTPTPTPIPTPASGDEDSPYVIVLLSDGANTVGSVSPTAAAAHAAELGIPVFTIALGTDDGRVTVVDPATGRSQVVQVPPDKVTLRRIAETTGAEFFEAPSADQLRSVYDDLGSRIGYDTETREVTHWFAALGAALVLAAGGFSLLWFNRFP